MKKAIAGLALLMAGMCHAQGTCPASAPSGITACYYADFAAGSDSNTGTDESHPWKRIPGMNGCTGNCAAVTPGAGDGFILKGGVTWDKTIQGLSWTWSGTGTTSNPGCTGSGCIYVGADPTWFTGASFSRPIFNNGGATGNTNQALLFIPGPGNYLIFDNIELTGFYWSGSPGFGTAMISLVAGTPNEGAHDTFEHLYMHGWTHDAGAVDIPCGIDGDTADVNNNTDSIIEYSVISGADTDRASCNGAIFGGPPYIAYNLMEYVGSCMVIDGSQSVHDNICQNTVESFAAGTHENGIEINDDNQVNPTVYNNILRHMGPGSLTFWIQLDPSKTAYIFNNTMYDTQAGNVLDFASQSEFYTGQSGTIKFWNNTVECGPDSDPEEVCANGIGAGVTAVALQNNHFITNAATYWQSNGPTPTTTTNLLQSKSTANGQGYTAAQTYAFSPTSAGNSTVGAGTAATSLCTASGAGTPCTVSTTYGVVYNATDHTVSSPGLATLARTSPPDIGAYQFSGALGYTITVSSITGNGTVTSSDSVINCTTGTTGTCTDSSASGTITLTFAAATGYSLSSVTGCTLSGTTCTVTTTATITATFTVNSYTLSTATTGTGSGTITGCAGSHNFGAAYSCAVSASAGSTLSSVSGCGGSGTTTYAGTMPASNCTVTASFAINTYTLGVTATHGTVTGANCTPGTYNYNTPIGACTATPDAGYVLTAWSGTGSCSAVSGTGTATCPSLTSNSTLTATFTVVAPIVAAPQMLMGAITTQEMR